MNEQAWGTAGSAPQRQEDDRWVIRAGPASSADEVFPR